MDFKLKQLIFHLPCAFSVSKIFEFRFLFITQQAQKSIKDCSGIFSVEETIQFEWITGFSSLLLVPVSTV